MKKHLVAMGAFLVLAFGALPSIAACSCHKACPCECQAVQPCCPAAAIQPCCKEVQPCCPTKRCCKQNPCFTKYPMPAPAPCGCAAPIMPCPAAPCNTSYDCCD